MSNANTELQVLEISKANHKTSIVVNTYRPPSGNQQDFLTDINSTMHEIAKSHYSDIYLLGDTNLDHTPVKKSEITNALENNMKAYRCKQCISSSTRKTASTSILIDTIYIKTAKKIKVISSQNNCKWPLSGQMCSLPRLSCSWRFYL